MDKSRLRSYFLDKNSKISDAINILQKNIIKLVVIVEKGKLVGIITDGDIRRGLIRKFSIDDKCKDIMNKKPIFIYSDEKNDLKNFDLKKDYHPERRYIIVVNKLEKVTDIIDRAESQQSLDNTILIMAGGEGRRMLPHTASLPKPMLRIKNKPIIRIIIDRLISHGFTNISISVKYKYDKLVDYFKKHSTINANINFLLEKKALGTAGSLSLLNKRNINKPIIVMNGDIITNINFPDLLRYHDASKNLITVCSSEYSVSIPFGTLVVNNKDKISKIVEKPIEKYLINAGIYVINPEILKKLKKNQKIDMTEIISNYILSKRVGIFPLHESWIDIGNPDDFTKAKNYI